MLIGVSGKINSGKDLIGKIIQYLTDEYAIKDELSYEDWINESNTLDIAFNKTVSSWEIKKYADKLKDIVCLLIGCTRKQLENREFKEKELGKEWNINTYGITKTFKGTPQEYEKFLQDNYFNIILSSINQNAKIQILEKEYEYSYRVKKDMESILTPRKFLQLLGTNCGRQIIHPNIWVNSLMVDYKKAEADFPNWIITDVRFPNEAQAIKDRDGINIRVNRLSKDRVCTCELNELEHLYEKNNQIYTKYRHEFICNSKEHESETALDNYKEFDYILNNNGTIPELIEKIRQILIKEKILND